LVSAIARCIIRRGAITTLAAGIEFFPMPNSIPVSLEFVELATLRVALNEHATRANSKLIWTNLAKKLSDAMEIVHPSVPTRESEDSTMSRKGFGFLPR
jgi:hypothetical protein